MFIKSFGFKMLFNGILSLKSPSKLIKNMVGSKAVIDQTQLALFLALLKFLYKGSICTMRRFCKDEKINSVVAAALSSVSVLADDPKRRVFLILLVFARALECIARSLKARGNAKNINSELFVLLFWDVQATFLKFMHPYDNPCMNKGMSREYERWTM